MGRSSLQSAKTQHAKSGTAGDGFATKMSKKILGFFLGKKKFSKVVESTIWEKRNF